MNEYYIPLSYGWMGYLCNSRWDHDRLELLFLCSSLTSPKPFAGVEQNLQRLLDKIDGKLKGIQNHEALRTKEDTVR